MKEFVFAALLLCLLDVLSAKEASPMVQLYSRDPGKYGQENVLICHVTGFHPPEILIKLLRNEEEMAGATQTDLAFEENWHYHLTKHAPFTPKENEKYTCEVTHMGKTQPVVWESDM